MKIRTALLSLLIVSVSSAASAQLEQDDMYFTSKDRAKLQASRPMTMNTISSEHEVATAINPTDSYSARNVNPEYISQSKVGSNSNEVAPYFIPDYTPKSVNQGLNSNMSSYSNYNNLAYSGAAGSYNMNRYYYGMSSMYGNPYGSGYNPSMYMNMYDPFAYRYNNYGFGMGSYYSYGIYNSYNPYNYSFMLGGGGPQFGWNSYYNMGYGMGYNYYPRTIIVLNDNNRNNNVVYGKRASRSSDINNNVVTYDGRNSGMVTTTDAQGRARGSSGRVSSNGNSGAYYQPGWRTNVATNSTERSSWSNSGRSGGNNNAGFRSNSGYVNRSNSSSSFSQGGSRSSGYSGGSSSGFSSGGGASRSSGGSVGGGQSSSGASRGRN